MSFTSTACYDLSTHTINFDQRGVEVILDSTGQKVDGATFASGFDIKIVNGDFCFGEITFNTYFDVTISLDEEDGGFEFVPAKEEIVGSNELDDPQVTKNWWAIDDCPIRMSAGDNNDVLVRCPCTTSGTPCTNECYRTT